MTFSVGKEWLIWIIANWTASKKYHPQNCDVHNFLTTVVVVVIVVVVDGRSTGNVSEVTARLRFAKFNSYK